jgi:hypothetical protein
MSLNDIFEACVGLRVLTTLLKMVEFTMNNTHCLTYKKICFLVQVLMTHYKL